MSAAESRVVELMGNLERSVAAAKVARDAKVERVEWLQRRRTGLGGSDVAAVLGISAYGSPWSTFADKVGLLPLDSEPTNEMRFGRYAELMVAPWFHDETGLYVLGEQAECSHPDEPWRMCTVDGFVAESPDAAPDEMVGLVEIKTRGPGKAWDVVPADVAAQALWQMHVTGLDRVWIAALLGRRLDIHVVERDQGQIDFIVDRVSAFWHDHVLTGTPPPTDGHDATARALAVVYPDGEPDRTADLDELADVIGAWRAAKAAEKAAKADVDKAANAIKAALGEACDGLVGGQLACSWRPQHRDGYTVEPADFRVLRNHEPKASKR